MGMCAEIIAIGPYSQAVSGCLNYRAGLFAETREGAILSVRLFGIYEGSSVSREFASCLGITNAWDFNQHKLVIEKVDIESLRDFGRRYADYSGYDKDVERFETLLKAGFEFHFRPEG